MLLRFATLFIVVLFAIPALAADKIAIAIVNFDANDVPRQEALKITELIRNEMVNSGLYTVVERTQVDKILREQGFQQTGCTDVSCAVQMGKLLSARKMLVGSVMRFGDQIAITGRIVDVEKGVAEFSEKEIASSYDYIPVAVERFADKLAERITGKKLARNEGLTAQKKKKTSAVIVYSTPSDYSGTSDPTLWLGVTSIIGSVGAFIGGAMWYNGQQGGPDPTFNAMSYLLMGSTFGNPAISFLGIKTYLDAKSEAKKDLKTRNNIYIGAGSAGGFALIMFITFGVRQANNAYASAGEIYRNGNLSVVIPPQYYSFSMLLKQKFPGIGLGVEYRL